MRFSSLAAFELTGPADHRRRTQLRAHPINRQCPALRGGVPEPCGPGYAERTPATPDQLRRPGAAQQARQRRPISQRKRKSKDPFLHQYHIISKTPLLAISCQFLFRFIFDPNICSNLFPFVIKVLRIFVRRQMLLSLLFFFYCISVYFWLILNWCSVLQKKHFWQRFMLFHFIEFLKKSVSYVFRTCFKRVFRCLLHWFWERCGWIYCLWRYFSFHLIDFCQELGSEIEVVPRPPGAVDAGMDIDRYHSHYVLIDKSHAAVGTLRVDVEKQLQSLLAVRQGAAADGSAGTSSLSSFVKSN